MIAEHIYLEKYNSYYEDEDPMFDIDEYEESILSSVETDDES